MRLARITALAAGLWFVLPGQANSQGKALVRINQELVDQILAAFPIPRTIRFPTEERAFNVIAGAPAPQTDAPTVIVTTGRATAGDPRSDTRADLEDGIVRDLLKVLNKDKSVPNLSPELQAAVDAILRHVPANQHTPDGVLIALDQATDAEFDAFAKGIRIWWEGEWVQVRINQRPAVALNNPLSATNLNASVQARGRACIHFIKDLCTPKFNTPWLTVGAGLNLFLRGDVPWVVGLPTFTELDIEITIKIDGKKFVIRIPITGLVNRAIQKKPPIRVFNLASLEQEIPYSGKKLRIQAIGIPSIAGELTISVTLEPRDNR